jgi:mRNA interferase MazF
MNKDFSKWFVLKKLAHEAVGTALFHEREIWWCKIGANVGFEIDGRGEDFEPHIKFSRPLSGAGRPKPYAQ